MTQIRITAAFTFLLLFASVTSRAADERDAVIRNMMASAGIPGLQTVVVKPGKVVRAKSYGYAVLDQPGPRRAMRDDSIVFSASVGKILVAIAVLQQVEQGRLKLDDDINNDLPFVVRNPAWPEVPITWRMLLTHTSSMKTEDDERESQTVVYGEDPRTTLDDYVKSVFVSGAKGFWSDRYNPGRPGSERIYSNDAFDLAAYALQRVIHEPFDHYVQRAIFAPLHMRNSTYWLAGRSDAPFAVGYASVRTKGKYVCTPAKAYWAHGTAGGNALAHQVSCPDYPSGCLHTTALDLSRLMLMFLQGGTLDSAHVLDTSSVQQMLTPTGLRNLDGWSQGLGLFGPEDFRGRQVWGHDGEDRGAANAFFFNPKTGVGAIALANAMDPDFTLTYMVVNIDLQLMSLFE